jgi:hypothetical protein
MVGVGSRVLVRDTRQVKEYIDTLDHILIETAFYQIKSVCRRTVG